MAEPELDPASVVPVVTGPSAWSLPRSTAPDGLAWVADLGAWLADPVGEAFGLAVAGAPEGVAEPVPLTGAVVAV